MRRQLQVGDFLGPWRDVPGVARAPDATGQPLVQVVAGAPSPRVAFSGDYPLSCGPHSLLRSVDPDEHYILGVTDVLWSELGGTLSNTVRVGRVPKDSELLGQVREMKMGDITDFSNNFLPSFVATGGGTYGAGQSVPEPSTILLFGLGGLVLAYLFCRRTPAG